jgi:heme oxygenase
MTFFGGHGAKTGAMWLSLGRVLDTFGATHEDLQGEVEQGACQMFRAIISGFQQHGHRSNPQ